MKMDSSQSQQQQHQQQQWATQYQEEYEKVKSLWRNRSQLGPLRVMSVFSLDWCKSWTKCFDFDLATGKDLIERDYEIVNDDDFNNDPIPRQQTQEQQQEQEHQHNLPMYPGPIDNLALA